MTSAPENPAFTAPRTWLEARDALAEVWRQTGTRFVVVSAAFDGLVGPLAIDEQLDVADLLGRVASATGTELTWAGAVAVFQAPPATPFEPVAGAMAAGDAPARRRAAFALGTSGRIDAVTPLMGAITDDDDGVRRTAVLGLAALEGQFHVNEWPGRLSLFELPDVKVDTDALMWIVEGAAPPGTRAWNAAVRVLGRAREPELPRTAWWEVWRKTPGAVAPTLWALGRCGDRDMRHPVETCLSDPRTNVATDRYLAAASLGRIGEIRRLAVNHETQPDITRRCVAAYGLGFCTGRADAIPALSALTTDPDPRVAQLAALSLGRLASPDAVDLLCEILNDASRTPAVRAAAAAALARAGRDPAGLRFARIRDALLGAAEEGPIAVRAAVAHALGIIGGSDVIDRLEPALGHYDRTLRAAAGYARTQLGPGGAWRSVHEMLTNSRTDLDVRIAMALGLGQSRAPDACELLAHVARDPDADLRLRVYATRSLAMLANRAGQEVLRELIETDVPLQMRLVALRHLDLGDPDATVEYLKHWAVRGRPRDEQSTAYERIGEIGTADGTRFLAGGTDTFDNYTRWACIWPLILNGAPVVRSELIKLLGSRRRSHRISAAVALGGLDGGGPTDPDVLHALIGACDDPFPPVRCFAADSLGLIGDPAAVPALVQLLAQDPEAQVAHHALRALRSREFAGIEDARRALERTRCTDAGCGVIDRSPLAAQPANSFVLRSAATDYNDLSLPNLSYETGFCFDAGRGRILAWGSHGRRYDTPQTNLTWLYDVASNRWRRPEPREAPPGICMTRGTVYDPVRGLVISTKSPTGMGGHGYVMTLRKFAAYSVPWVFDAEAEEWYGMRPPEHPPAGNQLAGFDLHNDAMILLRDRVHVYDPHVNAWAALDPPEPCPPVSVSGACEYDPVSGRLIFAAGADEFGRTRTWAYSLRDNAWEELHPAAPPPALSGAVMVYDSANDVMLAFRPGIPARVYALHLRANRWEELPGGGPAPNHVLFDAAYDARHNAVVLSGGEEAAASGALTVRETWTYRYRPAATNALAGRSGRSLLADVPQWLRLEIEADGDVRLAWDPVGGDIAGYAVYRGAGEHPWTAEMVRLNDEPVTEPRYTEAPPPDQPAYYHVRAIRADGAESEPSNLARTQPLPVRRVQIAPKADGAAALTWEPSRGPAVIGYNVYRADVAPVDLWAEHFDPMTHAGAFEKLTPEPVTATEFFDRIPGEAPADATESSWAPLKAYVVRAVNALGIESGPSPVTLSVPAAPGPVTVVPLPEGRTLVVSGESGSTPIRGHHLLRLTCYRGDLAFRTAGAPHPGAVFADDEPWPTGDRRAYAVIAVDERGQLGIPSSLAWADNMP
jgi:HEAT repeat protein